MCIAEKVKRLLVVFVFALGNILEGNHGAAKAASA